MDLAAASSPFSCTYSESIPALLAQLKCSLAISTYQAGKLIFISPAQDGRLVQLTRTFPKPMGIALDASEGRRMALACKDEVIVFANAAELGARYPVKPETYDAFYLPRLTYHTGPLDIHDLCWGSDRLFAVNTLFSCIVSFDDQYSFVPYWKPNFITKLAPEDRCHLNGMCLKDGKPKFATAFGKYDHKQAWKKTMGSGGLLIDVESNEIVLDKLPMPHSPRLIGEQLFLLFSATGEIAVAMPQSKRYEVIAQTGGFVRGMDHCGDYLFICLSKQRTKSSSVGKLNLDEKSGFTGILVMHLPTAKIIGQIQYLTSVEEIYDIRVLPETLRPNILNTLKPEHNRAIALPGDSYWAKPPEE